MELRIVDKFEDFCALESEWEDLLGRIESPQIFYKFQWAKCYLEYYAPEWKDLLCVVTGYENQKLVALFPFVLEKGVIRFITSKTADYNMVYVDNGFNRFSAMKKGVEYLLESKKIDRFCLNNFPGSSELYLLEEVLREMDLSAFIEEIILTPKISGSSESKFNKGQLKNIRNRIRTLQKEHNVEMKSTSELSENTLNFLAANKVAKYQDSSLKENNMIDFYRHLANALHNSIDVEELYVDEKLASARLTFYDDKKIYSYISAYDDSYAKYGVSMLHRHSQIQQALDDGKVFDFLRGNETFKFYFSDEAGMIFNLLAFRKGTTYTIMQRVMNTLKSNHFVRKMMGR